MVSIFGRRVLLWVFWDSGGLFSILAFKNTETRKYDWKKTYIFLVTNRSDLYLSQKPVYLTLIRNITLSIIVNNIQYINSYCQLKYGLLIQKSLKCYALIMIYKCFYKHKARAENYHHSHCYASCDTKIGNKKY